MKKVKDLFLRIVIYSQESSSNKFKVIAGIVLITTVLAIAGYFFGLFIGRSIYNLRAG